MSTAPDSESGPATPPVSPPTNPLASTAAVLGWLSLVVNPLASMSIVAIVLGIRARRRSRELLAETGSAIGEREARIGILAGSIGAVIWAILLTLFALFLLEVENRLS